MGHGVLGSLYDFSRGILNPRKLGLPVSRPRFYCIAVLRGVAEESFEEFEEPMEEIATNEESVPEVIEEKEEAMEEGS